MTYARMLGWIFVVFFIAGMLHGFGVFGGG